MLKRGFSKPNLIKSHLRASLALETHDALMQISMANISIDEIDWNNFDYDVAKKYEGPMNEP